MNSPARVSLGTTGLDVFPLCLGGNVFGWTADERTSFDILDAYVAAGGNFIDTADGYSRWVPGHTGGESERIIGKWIASRGNRDRVVISTKVFGHPEFQGLGGDNIRRACDASLQRLQTDYLDVYYAHHEDPNVPQEETLAAFTDLIAAGKVRVIGASNFSVEHFQSALDISRINGLARYQVAQDHYNLMERGYETTLRPVLAEAGVTQLPYYALASGFLSGKYRPGTDQVDSGRNGAGGRWLKGHCSDYLDDRGLSVLALLDEFAAAHHTEVATVALAWLVAQPTIGAAIASARLVEQLPALVGVADVALSTEEIQALTAASALPAGSE